MDDNTTQADFSAALEQEFGLEPGSASEPVAEPKEELKEDDPTPPAPAVEEEAPVEAPKEAPKEDEEESPNDDKPGAAPADSETAEEKANREVAEAAEQDNTPLTADDIRKVLEEDRTASQGRIDNVHLARDQIISTLHPEGIDKNIYDTNGNVIKTAQDIVDRGLVNQRTGEPYTYEEAASFMLEANQKMQKNIEELNDWAENIAEQNVSLMESNTRVMDKWGDILQAMPDHAKTWAENYIATQLEFDETGSYITRMAMSPEQYYELVAGPYRKLGEALVKQNELEASQKAAAEAKAAQEAKNEQNERNGLPPQRGTSATRANTGDPMLDALVDELNKG